MCIAIAAKVASRNLGEDDSGNCIPIINWNKCGLPKQTYRHLD